MDGSSNEKQTDGQNVPLEDIDADCQGKREPHVQKSYRILPVAHVLQSYKCCAREYSVEQEDYATKWLEPGVQ